MRSGHDLLGWLVATLLALVLVVALFTRGVPVQHRHTVELPQVETLVSAAAECTAAVAALGGSQDVGAAAGSVLGGILGGLIKR